MNEEKIGVISALNQGYVIVLRAFWVMLIPIALDSFFWLGPRLSIEPLFTRFITLVSRTASLGAVTPPNFDEARRMLSEVSAQFNLFALLATDIINRRILPLPTLKAFELPEPNATHIEPSAAVITLDNALGVMVVAALLLGIGVLIGMVYMTLIADQVRAGQTPPQPLPRRIALNWLRMLGFVVVTWGALLIGLAPLSLVFGLISLIHVALGFMVLLAAWLMLFWAILFLWFVAYAISIEDTGFWRAMWHSAMVVQRNLMSTLGLILLGNILVAGMGVVWQQLEAFVWGNIAGIIGNAFIGSGLVAGSFVFYQNRYRLWKADRSKT